MENYIDIVLCELLNVVHIFLVHHVPLTEILKNSWTQHIFELNETALIKAKRLKTQAEILKTYKETTQDCL